MNNEKNEVQELYEQGKQLKRKEQAQKVYELVERLNAERLTDVKEYKELGRKKGRSDVYTMPYTELYYLTFYRKRTRDDLDLIYHSPTWKAWLEAQMNGSDIPKEFRKLYLEGWVEGVLSVWEQVRDILN